MAIGLSIQFPKRIGIEMSFISMLPSLVERLGKKRLQRLSNILLAFPVFVILIVGIFYLVLWKTDPLLHFIHMIWVLGFWMVGTLTMFAFINLARLKLGSPSLFLIIASVAMTNAIYFTPLSRFTKVFSDPSFLVFSIVIGSLNMILCWLFIILYRNKLSTM